MNVWLGLPKVPICCEPEVPETEIKSVGSELVPPSTKTCIDPSLDEQNELVVFTATVLNEFGVCKLTES